MKPTSVEVYTKDFSETIEPSGYRPAVPIFLRISFACVALEWTNEC